MTDANDENVFEALVGPGSVTNVKPPIINGVVRRANLDLDILEQYEGDVNVEGNIAATGYVRGSAAGQTLNTQFYTFDDGEVTNSGDTYTNFANVDYIPVSDSSYLLIEYHATYSVNGAGDDDFRSRITVDGGEITWRDQSWTDSAGGGTRSAVIFPISIVYNNDTTDSLNIKVSAHQEAGDDTLTVNTNSAYLRVTEVAR